MKHWIKKTATAAALLALCVGITGAMSAATAEATAVPVAATSTAILLNDKHIDAGKVLVERGTTLVPLKPLAAAMGYTLSWNAGTKHADLLRPGRRVALKSGSATASVNGTAWKLKVPARVIASTLYVPLVSGVQSLGGSIRTEKTGMYITDTERYVTTSHGGSTYWVSQADGTLYARLDGAADLTRLGNLEMSNSPYMHMLTVRTVGKDAQLLELKESHYAMFNDFENGYQALLRGNNIVKQTIYHYQVASYKPLTGPDSTQLYLTDGLTVHYILDDGNLGKLLDLKEISGQDGDFRVEYASPDVLIARSMQTTRLFAIIPSTGDGKDLSAELISDADRKEWDRADGSDRSILSRMLTLTKREGNLFTFVYSPLPDGAAKKKTYSLPEK